MVRFYLAPAASFRRSRQSSTSMAALCKKVTI